MTELQWLIKFLTSQKLSRTLKDLVIERIGEVEAKLSLAAPPKPFGQQAPYQQTAEITPPLGFAIGQSPIAAQALAHREQAINQGISGKPELGRTSPRKF